jgi:hypothetical protein
MRYPPPGSGRIRVLCAYGRASDQQQDGGSEAAGMIANLGHARSFRLEDV